MAPIWFVVLGLMGLLGLLCLMGLMWFLGFMGLLGLLGFMGSFGSHGTHVSLGSPGPPGSLWSLGLNVILILLIEVSKLLRFSISEYLQMTWLPVSRMWVAASAARAWGGRAATGQSSSAAGSFWRCPVAQRMENTSGREIQLCTVQ